jgi:phosphate-selective porin OprO/OprP
MNVKNLILVGTLFGLQIPALPVNAQDQEEIQRNLIKKVEELEQKLRVLERKDELEQEANVEKSKTASKFSIGAGGLNVQSADTNFALKVRGYVQADARFYFNDVSPLNDTFLMRRVRPIFEGTVFDKYDYRLMLDFGSGATSSAANNPYVQDAYVNARFLPEFQVQVGKFKEPVGLERLQSGANLLFVERAYPTQLAPNRDVGVQLHGNFLDETISYAAGVFNGVADGGSGDFDTADDDKDIAGRLFVQPFKKTSIEPLKGLGFGIAGTIGSQEGTPRSYTSPGQQRIFAYRTGGGTLASPNVTVDGDHWRLAPQFYYYWGPLGIFGEYTISSQELAVQAGTRRLDRLEDRGWQIAASYFLTGEQNSFKAVIPKKPFSLANGGWGAWEVAARFSQLELDPSAFPAFASAATNARRATSWAAGVNWHLNRNVKFSIDYEQTDFDGGAASAFLSEGEQVLFSRVQFGF